jgi:cytochrome b subunit of formate dehydrogenase
MEKIAVSPHIAEDEVFVRMNLAERVQHWVIIVTFVLLMLTGLPLLFYNLKFFKWLFRGEQSFYIRGIIHRAAAVGLILNSVVHVVYTAATPRGRKNLKDMWPRVKDLRDAVQAFGYNLGLSRFLHKKGWGRKFFRRHPFFLFAEPPLYDRYNFIEKFEYWALVWGTLVMIVSGFFMWRVELSLRLFPLWVHNIFIIVHGYEAMLAFLAVIIWHMYNVHLNPEVFPMSKIWLTGKSTGREVRVDHPLEYLRIHAERQKALAGKSRPGTPRNAKRKSPAKRS